MSPELPWHSSLAALLWLHWVLSSVSGTVVHITGTLGGSVALSLETVSPEQIEQVQWRKGEVLLGKLTRSADMGGIQGLHKATYIFPNATFLIYRTNEEDNGRYTVTIYNASGALIYTREYLLDLQEPVVNAEDEGVAVPFLLGGCARLDLDLQPPSYAIWRKGDRRLTVDSASNDTWYPEDMKLVTSHVMTNGTLRLCQLETEDQGEYTADVLDGHGALMYRKFFKLWPMDGRTVVSVNNWATLPMLILIVTSSGFLALSVTLLLVRCALRRMKKDPEPVLEVITDIERKLRNPSTEDLVETDLRSSEGQVVYAAVVLATTPSTCPKVSPERQGAKASSFSDEDTISTLSREASTSHAEPTAPSNVSTFQIYQQ